MRNPKYYLLTGVICTILATVTFNIGYSHNMIPNYYIEMFLMYISPIIIFSGGAYILDKFIIKPQTRSERINIYIIICVGFPILIGLTLFIGTALYAMFIFSQWTHD